MDVLQKLLAGDYRDPDTGERLNVPVKSVVIRPSLAGSEAELVQGARSAKAPCDPHGRQHA